MKKQLFALFCLIISLSGILKNCNDNKKKTIPDSIIIAKNDTSKDKTKENIDFDRFKNTFIENERSHKYRNFLIKQVFYSKKGEVEHMWLGELKYNGKQFKGILINNPLGEMDIKKGDEITIIPDQISDWVYTEIETNNVYGGYTIKADYGMMSNEEKALFDSKQNGKYIDW